jgi:hypothetical protein
MIKFLIAKYYNFINKLFYENVEENDIENPNNFLIEIKNDNNQNYNNQNYNNQNDCSKWLYVNTII